MSLIAAAGSALGGILGKSKGYSPRESSLGHVEGLMQAAENFGINPLTLLNAGIPGGALASGNSSMGAGVADAAMLLGDAFAKKTDRAKLQQATAERDRLQQKVTQLTIRPKVPGIYGMPRMGGPQRAPVLSPDPLSDPVQLDRADGGGIAVPDPRLDRGAGGYVSGFRWDSAPGWSPAQAVEDEYGDIASWGYGLAKMAADTGYNARRATDALGLTDPGVNLLTGSGRKPEPKAKAKTVKKLPQFWTHPQTGFTGLMR